MTSGFVESGARGPQTPPGTPAAGPLTVRRMRPEDAVVIAGLHRQGIPTGVLAELGLPALARLYRALLDSPDSFVFVGVDARGRVVALVSGVTDVRQMYRRAIRQQFWSFAALGLRYAFRPRMVSRLLNTLLYPAKVAGAYPRAELLSIVVAPAAQGSGIGTLLLEALLGEFRRRRIEQVKVMVRADFARANAYYRKHGFALAGQIVSHGFPSNVYVRGTQMRANGRRADPPP